MHAPFTDQLAALNIQADARFRGRIDDLYRIYVRGAGGSMVPIRAVAEAKLVQGALLHAFKEAGWVDMGRLASRAHTTKKHIFCAPDMAGRVSKSELRRMVEEPAPARMALVK